jgi:LEM domain
MKLEHIPFAVRQMSDAVLSAELRALDQQSGPVTEGTRALYQRLLVRARRAAQEGAQQPGKAKKQLSLFIVVMNKNDWIFTRAEQLLNSKNRKIVLLLIKQYVH